MSMQRHSYGFSTIELIVGTALSALLLTGVLSVFVGSRSTYATIDQRSQFEDNGRYGLQQMVKNIRAAGYSVCSRDVSRSVNVLNHADQWKWKTNYAVVGFHAVGKNGWMPDLDSTIPKPLSGTDVLVIHAPKQGGDTIKLTSNMQSANDPLVVDSSAKKILARGDFVMVADCEGHSTFQVTGMSGDDAVSILHSATRGDSMIPGNTRGSLDSAYPVGSSVIPLRTITYYIGQAAIGKGSSLWQQTDNQRPEEVAEGAEDLQLLFGIDTDGDQRVTKYVTADAVPSWDKVLSVRISLHVRASTNPTDPPETLQESQTSANSEKNLLFTSTVTIRSAAP